jgi:hypothetical protein
MKAEISVFSFHNSSFLFGEPFHQPAQATQKALAAKARDLCRGDGLRSSKCATTQMTAFQSPA